MCTWEYIQPHEHAHCRHMESNYFQKCDHMSWLHSTHRDEEHKALQPLFLCPGYKNISMLALPHKADRMAVKT